MLLPPFPTSLSHPPPLHLPRGRQGAGWSTPCEQLNARQVEINERSTVFSPPQCHPHPLPPPPPQYRTITFITIIIVSHTITHRCSFISIIVFRHAPHHHTITITIIATSLPSTLSSHLSVRQPYHHSHHYMSPCNTEPYSSPEAKKSDGIITLPFITRHAPHERTSVCLCRPVLPLPLYAGL